MAWFGPFLESSHGACSAQFPRVCSRCKRVFPDFGDLVAHTAPKGAPKLDHIAGNDDPLGLLVFRNCDCGNTLCLCCEDVSHHDAFNRAALEEVRVNGRNEEQVLGELVAALAALRGPASTSAAAPEPLLLEVGAEMLALVASGKLPVPPYPAVAMRVDALLRADNASLDEIARTLAADPALVAAIIKVANSAAYSRGQALTSIDAAVRRLGLREVSRVVWGAGVGSTSAKKGPLASLRSHLWHRSVTTAIVAAHLAGLRKASPGEAFLAGLLRPFGEVVGALGLEEYLLHHPGFPVEPMRFWLRVLDHFRGDLGALVATRWQLPQPLTDVLSARPADHAADPALCRVIDVAAAVARLADERDRVSEAELAELVPVGERDEVAKALPESAALIAAFEASAEPPLPPAPSRVAPRPVAAPVPATPGARAPLVARLAKTPTKTYAVIGMAPRALVLEGAEPLQESFLASLELGTEPPLALWATAQSCTAIPQGFRIALAPFALTPEVEQRWLALVRSRS
ncbi:MAG: HDOD domain-containing protein [Deltaproteobacteria bacterium]|nr:HDOD domain-containing protein [Deltaproteobacteria bacterium]